jgi:hypothetical protein
MYGLNRQEKYPNSSRSHPDPESRTHPDPKKDSPRIEIGQFEPKPTAKHLITSAKQKLHHFGGFFNLKTRTCLGIIC